MRNSTLYLVVIIIILSGLTYIFYDLNKKHKADAERWDPEKIKDRAYKFDRAMDNLKEAFA